MLDHHWFFQFQPTSLFPTSWELECLFCRIWSWASNFAENGASAQKNVDFCLPVPKTVKSGRVELKCLKPAQLILNAYRFPQHVEVGLFRSSSSSEWQSDKVSFAIILCEEHTFIKRQNLSSLWIEKICSASGSEIRSASPLCVYYEKGWALIKLDYYGETVSKSGNERSYCVIVN